METDRPGLEPPIAAYYERGEERDRLVEGRGALELARTKELISRELRGTRLRVADVGGGPGAYARWLADEGHHVQLVDPMPLHVEQARAAHAGIDAAVGDARALPWDDGSFDAVLLLGPLYHLIERDDRLTALREAQRVLVDGGVLFAAAISRFAALLDLLVRLDKLHEPHVSDIVSHAVRTGVFDGTVDELFTTAYFHHADELADELRDAGFADAEVFNIEGPGFLVPDFDDRWADPDRREAMLHAARLVETEPSMMGASSHLLAIASK